MFNNYYDNVFDYIENEQIIQIAGATGTGKTIFTSLINFYLNEPTIVFGENIKYLYRTFNLLEVNPTNTIKFFNISSMGNNMEYITKKLKRFQSLSTLGVECKEIDYTTLILETETSSPLINNDLLKMFDKIILTYQTGRPIVSNNPCSEIELPRPDLITPNYKDKSLYYNNKKYLIKDIISRRFINDRNMKIDGLLNH